MGRRKKSEQLEFEEVEDLTQSIAPAIEDDDIDIVDSEDSEEAIETEDDSNMTRWDREEAETTEDEEQLSEQKVTKKSKAKAKAEAKEKAASKRISKVLAKVEDFEIKNTPMPKRIRRGKWQAVAIKMTPGTAVDTLDSMQEAIGLSTAIKSLGGTAKFRRLESGKYGVWRLS